VDGSLSEETDAIVFATGYDYRVPYLTRGGRLEVVDNGREQRDDSLSTNLRYIRPLYRHVFALDPAIPRTALAFIGLPMFVSNAISNTAQATLIAHALANDSAIPSREEMLKDLLDYEARLRAAGLDPNYVAHRIVPLPGEPSGAGLRYPDEVVRVLQDRGLGGYGTIPPVGEVFAPEWRKYGSGHTTLLKRGWERIEATGPDAIKVWVGDVKTEEGWADVMYKLVKWEERHEEDDDDLIST
jgi:hypothetical protein